MTSKCPSMCISLRKTIEKVLQSNRQAAKHCVQATFSKCVTFSTFGDQESPKGSKKVETINN